MATEKSVLAWYFPAADKRLKNGDGRLIRVGETHTVDGPPILCEHGLHASIKPLDALNYASSPIVFRVRLSGSIVRGDDKLVATSRTYVAELDATLVLNELARKCALSVIHLWDAPKVVIKWLETGNPLLKNAADGAARNAADGAAWNAADGAAMSAAAAWNAADGAAYSAAWNAAWNAQNKMFSAMLLKAIKEQK